MPLINVVNLRFFTGACGRATHTAGKGFFDVLGDDHISPMADPARFTGNNAAFNKAN